MSDRACALTECAVIDCDTAPVTVLSYSTYPYKRFPLCEPHRTESLAWIRGRWGAAVTITETALQPALLAREEAGKPC